MIAWLAECRCKLHVNNMLILPTILLQNKGRRNCSDRKLSQTHTNSSSLLQRQRAKLLLVHISHEILHLSLLSLELCKLVLYSAVDIDRYKGLAKN